MEDTLQPAKCLDCVHYHRPLCYKGRKVDTGYDSEGDCKDFKPEKKYEIKR